MNIRKFTNADYEKTASLLVELDALHLANTKDIKKGGVTVQTRKEHLASLLQKENTVLLVAEEGTEIIGFVAGEIRTITNHPLFKDSVFGTINDLIVNSKFQKQGVGRALIKSMEEQLKLKGASRIELKVYTFNKKAINFYEQLGYTAKTVLYEKEMDS